MRSALRPLTEAEQVLVTEHAHLPRQLARILKARGAYYDVDLLESVGNLGLVRAAQRFDPGRGYQFVTYASKVIYWEIKTAARELDFVKKAGRAKGYTENLEFNDKLLESRVRSYASTSAEAREVWEVAQRVLTPAQAQALLGTCEGATQHELARLRGVDNSWISTLRKQALTRLKEHFHVYGPVHE
jgi:RNA polymerase sigma factor (sigma-70 family)